LWLADNGLQQEKSRKSEKQRKKCRFFWADPLFFFQSRRFFGGEFRKLLPL
jgi:hypothetical protein